MNTTMKLGIATLVGSMLASPLAFYVGKNQGVSIGEEQTRASIVEYLRATADESTKAAEERFQEQARLTNEAVGYRSKVPFSQRTDRLAYSVNWFRLNHELGSGYIVNAAGYSNAA